MASAVSRWLVALHDRDLTAQSLDLVRRVVGRTGQIVEHDPRSGARQGHRLRAAETGPGAGDDRGPALQGHLTHPVSPPD